MKRIAFFLLVLLLIPCLIIPASASTVDAIEDQNFWLMGDLDWFDDAEGALGAIYNAIVDVVDRLDWLDSAVRDVETAIIDGLKTGIEDTLGEIVVAIKNGVNNIYSSMIQVVMKLNSIEDVVKKLLQEGSNRADEIIDEAQNKQDEIDDITDALATAPTINQDDIDSVISDVGNQFQNITSDESGTTLFGALGQIADLEIFKQVVPTSAMLGVLSFILFGKVF